jgi:hypothetical protein
MELDPTVDLPWYYRGCLLAYLGDEPAYRVHCDAMLKQFERGSPREGERTAKTCLLLAGTPYLARLNAMLDRALVAEAGEKRAWDQLAKAMAEYRAGRFEECIRQAGDAAAGLRRYNHAGKSAAELFAAMAYQRLGRHEKAGPMLDEAARSVGQDLSTLFGTVEAGTSTDSGVENWLVFHVTLREAKALIRGAPPGGAAPTGAEHERSSAGRDTPTARGE